MRFMSPAMRGRALAFGYSFASNVLAVLATVSAISNPTWVGTQIVLWLLVAMIIGDGVRFVRNRLTDPAGAQYILGTMVIARLGVLFAALAIGYYDGGFTGGVIAGTLAAFSILVEQALRPRLRGVTPVVAHVPGWQVNEPSILIANLLYAVNLLALLVAALSATLGFSQAWILLAVTINAALTVICGYQVIRYYVDRSRFERQLPTIMGQLAPRFAFHWQAPAGTAYQASMWLPYLARLDMPWFVLVRTAANFREVVQLTDAPVILRTGLTDLDAVVCDSLSAVFYSNTAVRNSHMIRFPHLTHIQLNHGDSDKIASVSPTFRQYDRNFVAGQAAIDRFAKHGVEVPPDQFVIVGRPQLENVAQATRPIAEIDSPTVLYSPTWSGFYEDSDYSSLPAGPEIVSQLIARGCAVIFRPHPYARRHPGNSASCDAVIALLVADGKATGRQHRYGEVAERQMSIVDCFNASQAMVSDVSSVVSDYLYSGKPFAMAAVSAHGEAFRDEFPLSEAAYVFDAFKDGRCEGFEAGLTDMLGVDTLAESRLRLRSYYLSETAPEHYGQRFTDAARQCVVEGKT